VGRWSHIFEPASIPSLPDEPQHTPSAASAEPTRKHRYVMVTRLTGSSSLLKHTFLHHRPETLQQIHNLASLLQLGPQRCFGTLPFRITNLSQVIQ
jgi:hypothetical protein